MVRPALAFDFPFSENLPLASLSLLSPDTLEETGEGRNQSHWLVLLTMLSLGERQDVANGLAREQEAGIWITALRGAHILLWDRISATRTVYL